jgi:hypothetical protein
MDPRSERAEQVASWYFRLNGFLSIPGFIVHPDRRQRFPLTEADLLGVRFPHSVEEINNNQMPDDPLLTRFAERDRILFVLVEVKTDLCNINGPWSAKNEGNMQRVIRRLGFDREASIGAIADHMYDTLRWENDSHVLQYVAVGKRTNPGLQKKYKKLAQVTWDQISDFLFSRFHMFPEKLPNGNPVHLQWPDFGRGYGVAFPNIHSEADSRAAVWNYIDLGSCL